MPPVPIVTAAVAVNEVTQDTMANKSYKFLT